MQTSSFLLSTLLSSAALVAAPGRIQAPDAPWKTFHTAHYRIHFPANSAGGFEPFAREVASKVEGIHAKVTEWVGYEAKGPIDVIIQDPVLDANGMAMPLLKRPHVILWKTPPEADSAIGHFTSWVDLLVVHELTHIHHMMRPQNQPNLWDRLKDLPVGPLAQKAPRWVTEGYATLVEGRITGSGRPHGVYRSSVIRQWALQGKLPSYGAVSGVGGFRGGSMAYLLGSAYLEWLERQNAQDPEILKKFWKQLVSRKRRPFEACFRATFGMSAQDGYDRWRAEVTHDALEVERRAKAQGWLREGEMVARFDGEIQDLAVSPDGTKLLGRLLGKNRPGLYVWDLAAKAPEPKKAEAKPEKPDPNEVEDRKPEFTTPKTLLTIRRRNGILPRHAWWSGKDRITFEWPRRNGEGMLEMAYATAEVPSGQLQVGKASEAPTSTEFAWKEVDGTWNLVRRIPDGTEQRLTRTLSAAWQPAPTPDGKSVYYVQLSATGCEIRKLDLTQPTGAEAPLPIPEPMVPRTLFSPADEPNLLPPPVTPPPAQDYSVSDTHYGGSRSGFQVMPAFQAVQVGWGGSDLLGRLNWHVLGSFGSPLGPRGATGGLAYRGWRWAPSLEVFSSLEQPSRQRFAPVSGFDRERRGGEFAFTWNQQGEWPLAVRPVVAVERVKGVEPSAQARSRGLAGSEASLAWWHSWGEEMGFRVTAKAQAAAGRTDGERWNLQRADLAMIVRLGQPLGAIRLRASEGRLGGNPTALDRFHLGGATTSLVPGSLDWNRLEQVALPDYLQTGDRLRRFRGEIGGEWYLYLEHAAVWDQSQAHARYQRVVGAELPLHDLVPGNVAEMLLGRFTFTLGVHHTLDGLMKGRTIGTATLVLRP